MVPRCLGVLLLLEAVAFAQGSRWDGDPRVVLLRRKHRCYSASDFADIVGRCWPATRELEARKRILERAKEPTFEFECEGVRIRVAYVDARFAEPPPWERYQDPLLAKTDPLPRTPEHRAHLALRAVAPPEPRVAHTMLCRLAAAMLKDDVTALAFTTSEGNLLARYVPRTADLAKRLKADDPLAELGLAEHFYPAPPTDDEMAVLIARSRMDLPDLQLRLRREALLLSSERCRADLDLFLAAIRKRDVKLREHRDFTVYVRDDTSFTGVTGLQVVTVLKDKFYCSGESYVSGQERRTKMYYVPFDAVGDWSYIDDRKGLVGMYVKQAERDVEAAILAEILAGKISDPPGEK